MFISVITFRAFLVYERQTRAAGTGGAPVQGAGLCSAGQAGLSEQGPKFSAANLHFLCVIGALSTLCDTVPSLPGV